jgi:phosphate:Na+ symporter
MDALQLIGAFAGGLGLFLLGMWLMTDGLKLAAGRALQDILGRWTRTRFRGLLAGAFITSVVQSSSAVTVAAIGFVNAGLLTLAQAVWVIFGANVGTTMTGWLVALVGFNFNIDAFALPLLGLGMLLRLTGGGARRGALGTALAGFGVFFLGIDVLKDSFARLGDDIDLTVYDANSVGGLLGFTLVGIALTTLMQSSSAALAIGLTAAAGGLVPLTAAAAIVVGANVGTTSTALLSVLGATANARRTAAAHIAFNLGTGVVALLALPWLLALIEAVRDAIELPPAPATTLALFHTAFNLLGVLLMWPLTGRLVAWLEQRFRTAEEDEGRPRFIDDNVLEVPALALDALRLELQHIGEIARRMATNALGTANGRALASDKAIMDRLTAAVGEFTARLYRASLSGESAARLPEMLRVTRYYDTVAELAADIGAAKQAFDIPPPALRDAVAEFNAAVTELLALTDTACAEQALHRVEEQYQPLKAAFLTAGSQGTLPVAAMENWLVQLSRTRRLAQQAFKAVRRLDGLTAEG